MAATHRGVTSRTKQRAHKKAWHSPSQGYFIILGTETCSQNGDHSLRSRTERARAPTTKICAAIRWVVRQAFTLRRTGPRRIAAWRVERSSARTRRRGTLRRQGILNFWVPNHVPKTVTTVCASERRVLTSAWQVVWPRARGSHFATQGRDASRSDEPTKAVRAQGGVALSVTRAFHNFGYRNVFPKR
jgi:hypothetical protein